MNNYAAARALAEFLKSQAPNIKFLLKFVNIFIKNFPKISTPVRHD